MRRLLLLVLLLLPGLAPAADELRLFNWNNYLAPETLQRFEAQCRCRVIEDFYYDNDELLARVSGKGKGYDVLVPTGFALETLIRQHALAPLEKRKLPNLQNIDPAYLNTVFDRGNRFSAPYAFTVTLLGYNEQKMKELGIPTESWAAIFDPQVLERIKGRVTVLDSPRELLAAALKYLGYSANETDPARWSQAKDVILKAKPYWAAFNASTYINELAEGNVWLAHGYSNDMYQAAVQAQQARKDFTIGFTIPREGAVLALDSMVIPKTAPRPDLAYKFINFALEARTSAELTNATGSGSPNRHAMKSVRPEISRNVAVFPDKTATAKLEMLRDISDKQRRDLRRLWAEIRVK